jgi:geranylgeranyl diphosphate synthase, type II
MMQKIKDFHELIEKEINAIRIPQEPERLYAPIRYLLGLGGKRMRPVLSMLAAELFGTDPKKALNPGLAIEFFHNFSLIHDDIMDDAPLRRGFETVHEKWNSKVALLSGDSLFVVAYHYLAQNEAKFITPLLHLFSVTVMEVCEGQQMDMDFETRDDVSIDEYIEMIRLKTSVLLGGALEMGAIVAEASEEERRKIYLFGQHVGIAFQLQDDILDLYGNPEKFGKQIGGDVIANKKTFLALKAKELATSEQRSLLAALENESDKQKKVEATRAIFDSLSIKELARQEMDKHFSIALASIDSIQAAPEDKLPLIGLAKYLMDREV